VNIQGDALREYLDRLVVQYENPAFISQDPISIPHAYINQADIEISGLFAAIFSWGQRTTIINKSKELMGYMGNSPHDFILHHKERDLKKLLEFKHRTFQASDLLYFIRFLKMHYSKYPDLESAFVKNASFRNVEESLNQFRGYFFSLNDFPHRTQKHISHPMTGSTCKRLCMYLRWMVRSNQKGVDFGLWKNITPADLFIPLDVHVQRVSLQLGLLKSQKTNWLTVTELTDRLKAFDSKDPVKYDFALFNLGIEKMPLL
jgi:uncharacterized protein (TIGR02757 family)